MAELTKEWLQQKIAAMESTRDEIPFGLDEDDRNTLAALRIALASLEAEDVGEIVLGEYDDCGCHPDARVVCIAADGQADWENFKDGTRLYTAPPAPVSVPDDVMAAMQKVARIRLDLNDFDGDKRGILDCPGDAEEALIEVVNRRAAMLQAGNHTEQHLDMVNSPVIPDGYVLVPKEITCAMDDAAWEAYHETRCMSDIWAALLAAAPQQEVK